MYDVLDFEVRFSCRKEIVMKRLKQIINESLGISDEVLKAAGQVADKIINDTRHSGVVNKLLPIGHKEKSYDVELLGDRYKVYVKFNFFRSREEWENYIGMNGKKGNYYNPEGKYVVLFVDVVNGWCNEQLLLRGLNHELSHLHYFLQRGKTDSAISIPSDIYKKAMKRFSYESDAMAKAAQAIYIRGTNEMSAFMHGLYGEFRREAKRTPFPNYEAVLKKSTVYRIYKNLVEFERDIDEGYVPNLVEIAKSYGLKSFQLKWIVRKARKRLAEAIGRLVARVNSDNEIRNMCECYDYGVDL